MIKFDVLNRWSGEIQFTAEIDCKDDESSSIKLGLAVRWAVKNRASLDGASLDGANLDGASLVGANLDGANLDGASLVGANLDGANLVRANLVRANLVRASLWNVSGLNDYVKCIQLDKYSIAYTSEVIQIGCERHSIEDWRDFNDSRILEMDGKAALEWWRDNKKWLFKTIKKFPAKPTKQQEIKEAA